MKNMKFSLFNKSKNQLVEAKNDTELVTEAKNWYSDRYESVLVQRNILFLFSILSLAAIFLGVTVVGKIASSKSIEPFVVEIENKTGITNVVDPFTRTNLSADEALNSYFIMQYLRARETYSTADYEYNYKTLVRLFSAPAVYNEFRYQLNSPKTNPITIYGAANSTTLRLRSIQYLEPGKTVQVRFSITETNGNRAEYHKIATMSFVYSKMELNLDDRLVNPLGFQITNYQVSDEIL
jgi:type IV secretion system protein VirB8